MILFKASLVADEVVLSPIFCVPSVFHCEEVCDPCSLPTVTILLILNFLNPPEEAAAASCLMGAS